MAEYNERVLVGDWNEKLFLKQSILKIFNQSKDKQLLLTQRTKNALDILLKDDELSEKTGGIVSYGDKVQIINPELNLALSSLISHKDIYRAVGLVEGCMINATKNTKPCVRNLFKIIHTDAENIRETLKYNEDFYLATVQDGAGPLYLQSDTSWLSANLSLSNHFKVDLVSKPNRYCRWQVLSYNKYEREDYEFCDVLANTPLRINHSASNKQLAIERKYRMSTIFGTEYEVLVSSNFDMNQREMCANAWTIM